MPVHAMVRIFGFSMLPQVISAAGSGPSRVLPFQFCLGNVLTLLFYLSIMR